MRILLDTNILLWTVTTPSARATQFAGRSSIRQTTFCSAPRAFGRSPSRRRCAAFVTRPEAVAEEARDIGFIELPVQSGVASRVADLPLLHRDPFDRLLVAQAIAEPAILYTTDARLPAYSELVRRVGAP